MLVINKAIALESLLHNGWERDRTNYNKLVYKPCPQIRVWANPTIKKYRTIIVTGGGYSHIGMLEYLYDLIQNGTIVKESDNE